MTVALRLRGKADARAAVRTATDAVHLRMHDLPAFTAIRDQRLDRGSYADLLQQLFGFHWRVEKALGKSGDGGLTSHRPRLDRLREDLNHLGRRAETASGSWTPPGGASGRLGCAYVAQGSALGGRVIARQLDYLLGDGAAGRLFFRGGPEDRIAWRKLLLTLEAQDDPAAIANIILGAEATFELFESCMTS